MKWYRYLAIAYLAFGLIEIIGEVGQVQWLILGFKPLLMPSLIAYFLGESTGSGKERVWPVVALGMSWLGDIFLMLDSMYFIAGLGSFLVAQMAYIITYYRMTRNPLAGKFSQWQTYVVLGILIAYGILLVGRIAPQLEDKLVPVIVYAISLLGMVGMAFLRNGRANRLSYLLVYGGAILFLISDSLIAVSNFDSPFLYDRYWIMLTYILAQFLIVNGLIAHVKGSQE